MRGSTSATTGIIHLAGILKKCFKLVWVAYVELKASSHTHGDLPMAYERQWKETLVFQLGDGYMPSVATGPASGEKGLGDGNAQCRQPASQPWSLGELGASPRIKN